MLRVAVVTGGHTFEFVQFQDLFRSLPGIDAYIQHMDDFASSPQVVRDGYDVVVFYHYLQEIPADEGQPWYCGKPRTAMEHLGETGQGIVVLHHALLAYPKWDLWTQLVGIADRSFTYDHDQRFLVKVAEPGHPITQDLGDWTITDETYKMASAAEGSQVLLTTDHPLSMHSLAWTRQHKRSRVFCTALGHDHLAWEDPSFRSLLARGIAWTVNK